MKIRRGRSPRDIIERFYEKLEIVTDSGCWIWTGATDPKGYGRFMTTNGRAVLAHRFSWEVTNGEITDGLYVLHRCDVPPCVNPAHLFLGSPADNTADMMKKGRCRVGENDSKSILTTANVIEIKGRLALREVVKTIAASFAVSEGTINSIKYGRSWRHVSS